MIPTKVYEAEIGGNSKEVNEQRHLFIKKEIKPLINRHTPLPLYTLFIINRNIENSCRT